MIAKSSAKYMAVVKATEKIVRELMSGDLQQFSPMPLIFCPITSVRVIAMKEILIYGIMPEMELLAMILTATLKKVMST